MASTKISIGSVSISGHLLGIIRKTSDLSTIVGTPKDLYPSNNGSFEFTGLDPDMYRLEVRDSPDGVALGTLIGSTYSINVEDNSIDLEYVFYTTDGPDPKDPASLQPNIIDPYLDGKNIQGVFKEGFRFLKKTTEYSLIAGGGVHKESENFSPGEVLVVIIAGVVTTPTTTAGLFAGSALISVDVTVDSTQQNKKTKCNSTTTRLTITLPALSSVPQGKFYYFTTFGCNQYQTKFITTGGETIEGFGAQIVLGRNEFLWLEKRSTLWEVLDVSPGVHMVGRIAGEMYLSFINTLPSNDGLYNALDYPRPHYWLLNILPATHKIITTDGAIAGLARTNASRAMPIVSPGYFRMPDSQGWSQKGLSSFTSYGSDTTRLLDYPGGWQPGKVGTHLHKVGTQGNDGDGNYNHGPAHNVETWLVAATQESKDTTTDYNRNADGTVAGENIVDNFGVIYLMYI